MSRFGGLIKCIVEGDGEAARLMTRDLLASGVSASEILDGGLLPGIRRIGELFEQGEYFLPELLMGGEATIEALQLLDPLLTQSGSPYRGRYLIGTVKDDVHDIGKNIVSMMLKGSGWEVTDLGTDVPPERFVEEIRNGDYDILGLSALLTMTMPAIVDTIDALEVAGLRHKTKIMVGGAPVTRAWAQKIGADAYAEDGPGAIRVAVELLGEGGVQ